MKLKLITVGKNQPFWVTTAYQEYAKRLPAECALQLIEIPLRKRVKNADIDRLMRQEGELMLAQTSTSSKIVTLEVLGQQWDTPHLAKQLQKWREEAREVCLMIGGPEGLAPACLAKAEQRWSLSPLTLPHPLVRIIVAEQLYRAWTILTGHPYHK